MKNLAILNIELLDLTAANIYLIWNVRFPRHDALEALRKDLKERYRRFLVWSNGQRTPLTLAVSKDEGRTWTKRRDLEGNPDGWLCYIACLETDGALLLGYCAEDNLSHSRITRVPLGWIYGPGRDDDFGGFFRD